MIVTGKFPVMSTVVCEYSLHFWVLTCLAVFGRNPQVDLQAQDRAHRIGQKKEVQVFRFCTEVDILPFHVKQEQTIRVRINFLLLVYSLLLRRKWLRELTRSWRLMLWLFNKEDWQSRRVSFLWRVQNALVHLFAELIFIVTICSCQ